MNKQTNERTNKQTNKKLLHTLKKYVSLCKVSQLEVLQQLFWQNTRNDKSESKLIHCGHIKNTNVTQCIKCLYMHTVMSSQLVHLHLNKSWSLQITSVLFRMTTLISERAQSYSCSIEISDTYVYIYVFGRMSSYMRMLGGT